VANRDEIKALVGFMMLAFPNFHPDLESEPNTIDVFEDLLGDIEGDKLRQGMRIACKEPGRAFAPSPGEIIGAVNSLPSTNDPMKTLNEYLERKYIEENKHVKALGQPTPNKH
jgi:hypothetical protein